MKKLQNIANKKSFKILTGVSIVLIYLLLFVLWEAGNYEYIPSPSKIVVTTVSEFSSLLPDLLSTLYIALFGLVVGTLLAVITVILMSISSFIRKLLSPLVVISQAIPFSIIAPIFIMIFGIGILPKLVTVTLVCYFPLVLTLISAFDNIDSSLVEVAKLFGAGPLKTIYYLRFPLSMPSFFSGTKISAVYCMSSAVISEWMIGDSGIGAYMLRAKRAYQGTKVFSVVLIVILISILFYYILGYLEKKSIERITR